MQLQVSEMFASSDLTLRWTLRKMTWLPLANKIGCFLCAIWRPTLEVETLKE